MFSKAMAEKADGIAKSSGRSPLVESPFPRSSAPDGTNITTKQRKNAITPANRSKNARSTIPT